MKQAAGVVSALKGVEVPNVAHHFVRDIIAVALVL